MRIHNLGTSHPIPSRSSLSLFFFSNVHLKNFIKKSSSQNNTNTNNNNNLTIYYYYYYYCFFFMMMMFCQSYKSMGLVLELCGYFKIPARDPCGQLVLYLCPTNGLHIGLGPREQPIPSSSFLCFNLPYVIDQNFFYLMWSYS